mgnify:CR=1 FL=1
MLRSLYPLLAVLVLILAAWLLQQTAANYDEAAQEQLIVYGTLTHPLVRFYACRCHTPTQPIELPGFAVADRNLVSASSTVKGQLLQVTPTELTRFDRYEGVPEQYERVRLSIGTTTAWVYRRVGSAP